LQEALIGGMQLTARKQTSSREVLLDAACRLVQSQGAAQLTLDAVAASAGMSKGGLLYHFPTKEALIQGMLDHLLAKCSEQIGREMARQADTPGKWVRAYVRTTFAESQEERDLSAGLVAAVATNPSLLEPLRAQYRKWQEQVESDGIDPALATVIRLAADGLWFAELFDLAPPAADLRERIFRTLLQLAGGECP
jgi:AcrR family transcriptional regulator